MIRKDLKKKKLKELTQLEREHELKIRRAEEEERINTLGQSSELAAKPWVQKEFNKQIQGEREYFDLMLDELTHNRKKKKVYFRLCADIFMHFCSEEDISKKWGISINLNDRGMVVYLKPSKYHGAIAFSGLPHYDFHACKLLAVKLGNTVAKLEGYVHTTESGILIPDQEDVSKFTKDSHG